MKVQQWVRISFFNLLIVAAIGVTLRYKIIFSLPFIDQKHLMHGHSHFAFTGWVTQVLMALLVQLLSQQKGENLFTKYRVLLWLNLVSAYGMLFSFPVQGYGWVSISFSTLSIFVSYFFAVWIWRDFNRLPQKQVAHFWFKAAVVWNALSSVGAFALAVMMATKTVHQNWYLLAVYWFLHFQYNGWFLFACLGLLFFQLKKAGVESASYKSIFWLFTWACIPAYFLSALWLHLPLWANVLIGAAAVLQIIGWVIFIKQLRIVMTALFSSEDKVAKWLILLSGLAFSIKILLQLGSTIPSLSDIAFGFRPIVIGYLHLVLLGVVTLFIIGYCFLTKILVSQKINVAGAFIFTGGVLLNECLLMLQGVTAMSYIVVPYSNEALLATAVVMFTGLVLLLTKKSETVNVPLP
jgi:hypothetical protein